MTAGVDDRTFEVMRLIRDLGPEELAELTEEMAGVLHATEIKRKRDSVSPANQGTAKDTAVQRLAAEMLKFLLNADYRSRFLRALPATGLTYDEVSRFTGVSRERNRKLMEQLCPLEYEAWATRRRRTG